MFKSRLQTKNYVFKYKNLPHAFMKEITENSFFALYQGAAPYLITYCVCVSLQFTIYEYIMKMYKIKYTPVEYKNKEFEANLVSSFLGGAIGSAVTNSFDVITVNK